MGVFNCKMCGGPLNVTPGATIVKCEYCRTLQTLPTLDEPKKIEEDPKSNENTTVDPLLRRAFMCIEDGEFRQAGKLLDEVLNRYPENAHAYLGKLMINLRVKTPYEFAKLSKPIENHKYFQKALRFADSQLRSDLFCYADQVHIQLQNQQFEEIYLRATNITNAVKSENGYKNAAELYESIRGYKDSALLAERCREEAKLARLRARRNAKIAIITLSSLLGTVALVLFAILLKK